MLNENPLIAFSIYTHIQVTILREFGSQTIDILDNAIADKIMAPDINRAYGLFWLWVLGAYEVVRTMVPKAEQCFSGAFAKELKRFKKNITIIRIPFAKQQLAGKSKVISTELSIFGFDVENKDFTFSIQKKELSVRKMINDFENLFSKIKQDDVIADIRTIYK